MKTITLALWLAASANGVALASESRHAVIVDMPKVISLTHASPDTWHTLQPVQPYDESTSTATSDFGAPSVFGQKIVNWDVAAQRLSASLGTLKEEVHEATH
jgi:hypothetical protein